MPSMMVVGNAAGIYMYAYVGRYHIQHPPTYLPADVQAQSTFPGYPYCKQGISLSLSSRIGRSSSSVPQHLLERSLKVAPPSIRSQAKSFKVQIVIAATHRTVLDASPSRGCVLSTYIHIYI